MHVLFIGTYGLWSPHLETELELADGHLEAGDRVSWLLCDGAFEACEPNPERDPIRCRECTWYVEMGMSLLAGPVDAGRMEHWLTPEDRARLVALPERFGGYDELKAFHFEGLDAGWAALSSATWLARDARIDPGKEIVARLLRSSVTGYLAVRRFLDAHPDVERVYVFNGRMAPMRGALRGTRERGVECVIHERGPDLEHYGLFVNAMPHEIEPNLRAIDAAWRTSELPEEERRRIGAEWFEGRPQGKLGSWTNFLDGQSADALPEDWDPDAHNVVLFTTTEFEFAAIGKEWESPLFESPHAATLGIARALSARGKAHLTVRLHPNPDGARSSSVEETLALDLPGVTVVPPGSEVSTYDLMRAADVVVTSASTTGVEATFWGKPSVLAGRSLYWGTGACHEPTTREELYALLEDPELPVADRDAALRFGFFQATRGVRFRHFEPRDLFNGHFKGHQVAPTARQDRILRLRRTLARRRV